MKTTITIECDGDCCLAPPLSSGTGFIFSPATTMGNFTIDSDQGNTSYSFPTLTESTGIISIGNCLNLASIDLPELVKITGDTILAGNLRLKTWNAPQWLPTNGTQLNFAGCSLDAASVNQILARAVAAGVTSCSIFTNGGNETSEPNSPPTGQGLSDKDTLLAAGNTVSTN